MEPFNKVAQELLDEITGMLSMVDAGTYASVVNNLLAAQNVVVAGSGRSRWVLGTFVRGLSRMGHRVCLEGESTSRPAGKGDVLLTASLHGTRGPLSTLAEASRKRGARVVAIVGETSCILASQADLVVPITPQTRTPFETIAGRGRLSLLAFDGALMVYLDAVLRAVQEVLGITPEALADGPGDDG